MAHGEPDRCRIHVLFLFLSNSHLKRHAVKQPRQAGRLVCGTTMCCSQLCVRKHVAHLAAVLVV